MCDPSARPVSASGEVHDENAAPSSRHSKVAPVSVAVNEKLADAVADGSAGCAVMVVSGAPVSTLQVKLAGVASVLPAESVARTENVCEPSARPVIVADELQAAYGAASSLHSNVDPGFVDVKEKLAKAEVEGSEGWDVIAVSGAPVSTVHV